MTATPHKENPENICLFLSLLDKDVYGDVKSLEEAMTRQDAPFYLRRVKEALVSFPDPETGKVKALFTKRMVKTSEFAIDTDEYELYDQLTTGKRRRSPPRLIFRPLSEIVRLELLGFPSPICHRPRRRNRQVNPNPLRPVSDLCDGAEKSPRKNG